MTFRNNMALAEETFRKNMALAKEVLQEIKETVTTSHDIISRIELPVMTLNDREVNEKKFGKDKMREIIEYFIFAEKIRNLARSKREVIRLESQGKPAPMTTIYVAVTMMGIGECADTSNLAMLLLGKKGCQSAVNIIHLSGEKPNGESFDHGMIVIGNCDLLKEKKEIKAFEKLSDDCVLLDPLLGVVGKANQLLTLETEKDYLKIFNVHTIVEVVTSPKNSKQLVETVLKNAKELSDEWCKEIGGRYKRNIIKDAKEVKEIKELSNQFGRMEFNKEHKEALLIQLKRVTGEGKNWLFSKKEKSAFLVASKEALDQIMKHLKGVQFEHPLRKVKNSEDYLLAVPISNLEILKRIEPIPIFMPAKELGR